MPAFTSSLDIGNRALQHCGAKRISSFSENSVAASEVSFSYDKLREAELQANLWTFAVKRTPLRPIDINTMLLTPSLWSSATTYYRGSIVSDENNNFWVSRIPSNLNNDPLLSSDFWQPYFGPRAVPLYDTTGKTSYFVGELVYTTPGDGTYRVFNSIVSANADDPLVKTVWLSTATYFKNQVVTFYPLWLVGSTYSFGAAVTRNGISYVSLAAGNIGNDPATDSTHWMILSLTSSNAVSALEWNVATAYSLNNIVDYSGSLYIASASSTGLIPPSNGGSWTAITGGVAYQSLIDVNTGNEPDLAPALWASGTTYAAGNKVGGSDGIIYQSVGSGNIGHDPTTDGGVNWTNTGILNPWTTVFTGGSGSVKWLEIGGAEFPGVALTTLNIIYPIGSGPASQTTTKNVYRLPHSYLRIAPQNPKKATAVLGGPTGDAFDDWLFESDYLITWDTGPIVLRFVADITDVRYMHAMFCEGLAARIALEIVERVTQSTAKVQIDGKIYESWISRAKLIDQIEDGYIDPPDDDWLTVRI